MEDRILQDCHRMAAEGEMAQRTIIEPELDWSNIEKVLQWKNEFYVDGWMGDIGPLYYLTKDKARIPFATILEEDLHPQWYTMEQATLYANDLGFQIELI